MNAIAGLFGVTPDDRSTRVAAMLANAKGTTAGYWLQLLLAMAIATLGLSLDSTAVVIGAMLVSPLMTPLLALGMGLAVGSPLLVVRSALRVVASVVVVVISAAIVTVLLPIHEVTTEISSRTSPTALDLAIASCCAVAGVYAVIRPGSDTTSAAAGTSIGIALVPPLCVVGFGIGTTTLAIATGAALLFTANLCAILLFSVLGFVALGYGSVPVAALERAHLHADADARVGIASHLARRLSVFFASKLGPAVRIAMPIALVAAVSWPLSAALVEVSWEVRVRVAAREALQALAAPSVSSNIRIERREVSIRLVTVGSEADAARLRAALVQRIAKVAGGEPAVEVVAVPDAKSLARAEAALRDRAAAPPVAPVAHADLALVRREVQAALDAWPGDVAGPLLTWRLSFARGSGPGTLELVHIGRPLGAAGESLIARTLAAALHEELRVRDVAFDPEPRRAARLDAGAWLAHLTEEMSRIRAFPDLEQLYACIETPRGRDVAPVVERARATASFPDARVVFSVGDEWMMRWSATPCASPGDGGTPEAGGADTATVVTKDAGAER